MRSHFLFKNVEFIDFPETHRKIKGCYLIDDIYIGASHHIRVRILQHIQLSIRKTHHNRVLQKHLREKIETGSLIKIKFLSDNVFDEENLTKKYDTIHLTNSRYYQQNINSGI